MNGVKENDTICWIQNESEINSFLIELTLITSMYHIHQQECKPPYCLEHMKCLPWQLSYIMMFPTELIFHFFR